MVTKLKFKGERTRKRKRQSESATEIQTAEGDYDRGWVDAESLDDISTGPLFVTFGSETPMAIACDPLGKVYASPVVVKPENGDPEKLEPDDVRQVWIATRLAQSEKISLKTATGKFLSCDKVGILSASREAIGPQEEWRPVRREDGWTFQNVFDKFLQDTWPTLG
jgi:protein FRG1